MRRSDLGLKLLSLALGAALLVVVRGERRVTVAVSVPLEVRLPRGIEAVSAVPPELRVSLSGEWAQLRTLDASEIGPLTVGVSRASPGVATWYARTESLHLPAGVRVESVYPSQGTVDLQRSP